MTFRAFLGAVLCAGAWAQAPVGELAAPDARVDGGVVITGTGARVVNGSTVTAGASPASLLLARGGELRVCPHSSLSVNASATGRQLMLSLGTGAVEVHYSLADIADTVVTPDFRFLLAGPGEFHFAIAVDNNGNTCVRALPLNSASVIVNEVFGDGVYQVRPQGQVLFRNGSVKNATTMVPPDCGCPPPARTLLAETTPAPAPHREPPSPSLPANSVPPLPAPSPDEVHVQVDAPFVFRAIEPAIVPPPPVVATLQLQALPPLLVQLPPVQPPPPAVEARVTPPAAKPAPKRGFFGRVRSFFAAIFR